MQPCRESVLLLDFVTSSNLGADLRSILDRSTDPRLNVHHLDAERLPSGKLNFFVEDAVSSCQPRLVFLTSVGRLDTDARAALRLLLQGSVQKVPVVLALKEVDASEVVELLNLGATDFLSSPFCEIDVLPRVSGLLHAYHCRERTLSSGAARKFGLRQIVGESANFQRELEKIPLVSSCDASVMISGETGTGKELFARAVHHLSPRANKPFIPVNCGAIPKDLFENEFFGHQRGAYTDAKTSHTGLIEEAEGGTLFLDEVDCLSSIAQVKILRFLAEKEFRPLGSSKPKQANVRIIAASNSVLEKEVKNGNLRRDLYYRLNVIQFSLPALRDRKEDIPTLAMHFVKKYCLEFGKSKKALSSNAIEKLLSYDWPGNVRELENAIQRAVVLVEKELMQSIDIDLPSDGTSYSAKSYSDAKAKVVWQFEETYLRTALKTCKGNITQAALRAQKNRRAFWELVRKHRIDVSSFKP